MYQKITWFMQVSSTVTLVQNLFSHCQFCHAVEPSIQGGSEPQNLAYIVDGVIKLQSNHQHFPHTGFVFTDMGFYTSLIE